MVKSKLYKMTDFTISNPISSGVEFVVLYYDFRSHLEKCHFGSLSVNNVCGKLSVPNVKLCSVIIIMNNRSRKIIFYTQCIVFGIKCVTIFATIFLCVKIIRKYTRQIDLVREIK